MGWEGEMGGLGWITDKDTKMIIKIISSLNNKKFFYILAEIHPHH